MRHYKHDFIYKGRGSNQQQYVEKVQNDISSRLGKLLKYLKAIMSFGFSLGEKRMSFQIAIDGALLFLRKVISTADRNVRLMISGETDGQFKSVLKSIGTLVGWLELHKRGSPA